MAEGSGTAREISLGEDFGDVAVRVNGVRVEVRRDGFVTLYTTEGKLVVVNTAVDDDAKPKANTAPQVGDKRADGTVYAGMSPDTGKRMYTTPRDAGLIFTFKKAKDYAAALDAHGHQDWRVPTRGELSVLFQNSAAIGGFDISGSDPAGWYWSDEQGYFYIAWGQRFSDGIQDDYGTATGSSLRCVR